MIYKMIYYNVNCKTFQELIISHQYDYSLKKPYIMSFEIKSPVFTNTLCGMPLKEHNIPPFGIKRPIKIMQV